MHAVQVRAVYRIPRSIDRGPIEALGLGTDSNRAAIIPRSIDRGPIEATAVRPERRNVGQFRDQLIAAPLKRTERVEVSADGYNSAIN